MITCKIYNKMLQNSLNPNATHDSIDDVKVLHFQHLSRWEIDSSCPLTPDLNVFAQIFLNRYQCSSISLFFCFDFLPLSILCLNTDIKSFSPFVPMWLTSPEVFVCAILRRALKLVQSRALSPSRVQTWLTHPLYRSILKVSSLVVICCICQCNFRAADSCSRGHS